MPNLSCIKLLCSFPIPKPALSQYGATASARIGCEWPPDSGLVAAILMSACRNLMDLHHPEINGALVTKYKNESIRELNHLLQAERISVTEITFTKALVLAADSI